MDVTSNRGTQTKSHQIRFFCEIYRKMFQCPGCNLLSSDATWHTCHMINISFVSRWSHQENTQNIIIKHYKIIFFIYIYTYITFHYITLHHITWHLYIYILWDGYSQTCECVVVFWHFFSRRIRPILDTPAC